MKDAKPLLQTEMQRGLLVGMPASSLIVGLLVPSVVAVFWAALLGAGVGALIGLLLWVGADGQPEEQVVPPVHAGSNPRPFPPREGEDR